MVDHRGLRLQCATKKEFFVSSPSSLPLFVRLVSWSSLGSPSFLSYMFVPERFSTCVDSRIYIQMNRRGRVDLSTYQTLRGIKNRQGVSCERMFASLIDYRYRLRELLLIIPRTCSLKINSGMGITTVPLCNQISDKRQPSRSLSMSKLNLFIYLFEDDESMFQKTNKQKD